MPLVAMDLYGDKCGMAYFPPEHDRRRDGDDDDGDGQSDNPATVTARDAAGPKGGLGGTLARYVGGYGGGGGGRGRGAGLVLRTDDAGAYRAIRRYLNKGEGHAPVLEDAVVAVVGGGVVIVDAVAVDVAIDAAAAETTTIAIQ